KLGNGIVAHLHEPMSRRIFLAAEPVEYVALAWLRKLMAILVPELKNKFSNLVLFAELLERFAVVLGVLSILLDHLLQQGNRIFGSLLVLAVWVVFHNALKALQ